MQGRRWLGGAAASSAQQGGWRPESAGGNTAGQAAGALMPACSVSPLAVAWPSWAVACGQEQGAAQACQ